MPWLSENGKNSRVGVLTEPCGCLRKVKEILGLGLDFEQGCPHAKWLSEKGQCNTNSAGFLHCVCCQSKVLALRLDGLHAVWLSEKRDGTWTGLSAHCVWLSLWLDANCHLAVRDMAGIRARQYSLSENAWCSSHCTNCLRTEP